MGQCTSSESNRISSGPNSPQTEFLPSIVVHCQKPVLTIDTTANTKETGVDSKAIEVSPGLPIKGIRKLKPRRRSFFNTFHQKQHVTFVTTPEEVPPIQFQYRPPVSIPSRRIRLQKLPTVKSTLTTTAGEGKVLSTGQECRSATTSSMGNNLPKHNGRESTKLSKTSKSNRISKTSVPLSRSTAATLCSESKCDQRQELGYRKQIPTSQTLAALNSSTLTVQELESSRQEKNLLRARFFSETPSVQDTTSMSTNKFGFKPTAGGGSQFPVPPKGTRTFQYQPPAPTKVTPRTSSLKGHSTEPQIPFSMASSLSRLPNLNFVQTETKKSSKSTSTLMAPPRHQVKPVASTQPVGLTKLVNINTNRNEALNGISAVPSFSNTNSATISARDSNKLVRTDTFPQHGFGWTKAKSSNSYRVSAETQVRKPSSTRPFYLFDGTSVADTKSSFPRGISTGLVATRKSIFEGKEILPPPGRSEERQTFLKRGEQEANHKFPESITVPLKIQPEIPSRFHAPDHPVDKLTETKRSDNSENVNEKYNLEQYSSTTSTISSLGEKSDENENGSQGQSEGQVISRPQSGRSLSRERDAPISDSEYLIDDEISDQPELTLNFQDSSLVVLSRSSSEDSLILPFDVTQPQSPFPTSGTRIESPFHGDGDGATETDAKSDSGISSKPDEFPRPDSKSIGGRTRQSPSLSSEKSFKWNGGKGQQSRSSLIQPSSIRVPPQRKSFSNRTIVTENTSKKETAIPTFTPIARGGRKGPNSVPSTTGKSSVLTKQNSIPVTKTITSELRATPRVTSETKSKNLTRLSSTNTHGEKKTPSTTTVLERRTSLESSTVSISAEALQEILTSFAEVKKTLFDLQDKLEEVEESEREKDKVIAALSAQLNLLRGQRCHSCGKHKGSLLFPTTSLEGEDTEESDEEKVSADIVPEIH